MRKLGLGDLAWDHPVVLELGTQTQSFGSKSIFVSVLKWPSSPIFTPVPHPMLTPTHSSWLVQAHGLSFWRIQSFWFSVSGCRISSVQLSSVTQSCLTLCNPVNHSTPGLPVHHQLSEFTQTHVCRVGDAIQPPHPLSSPSPPAPNPSQHQGLFQWVNSLHEVAKVLEFQL